MDTPTTTYDVGKSYIAATKFPLAMYTSALTYYVSTMVDIEPRDLGVLNKIVTVALGNLIVNHQTATGDDRARAVEMKLPVAGGGANKPEIMIMLERKSANVSAITMASVTSALLFNISSLRNKILITILNEGEPIYSCDYNRKKSSYVVSVFSKEHKRAIAVLIAALVPYCPDIMDTVFIRRSIPKEVQ